MKKITSFVLLGILMGALITACNEGPAERKGKKIDNTVEKVKDKIQNKGPAQKAGEKLDKMTDND
ncbi:MAG: hypothetical protein BGO90_03150 [Legionella sp. 40-6]|nr:hypothetical protein [Legionella sp.]OJY47198.1 MAG: hypothetical protein BGO90_03150 [Legionella sp. 40-6]